MEVERCFKVLPKGLSHSNGGLLCESSGLFKKRKKKRKEKATEIRYRTPGAHPDTGFDPRKDLGHSLSAAQTDN